MNYYLNPQIITRILLTDERQTKKIYTVFAFVGCVLISACNNNKTAPSKTNCGNIDSLSSYATSDVLSEDAVINSQTNDTIRFLDILESSSYPFSDNEDDFGKYNLLYSGYDTTVDSMVILSDVRKYNHLTKKEALTIINYATNNINEDAAATIFGATGDVFVNDQQFFNLMVHIAKEIPDTLKIEINSFLMAGLVEYGLGLTDAEVIDISDDELCEMYADKISHLDSIISLRNSWAEAVKDHPVHYGATE